MKPFLGRAVSTVLQRWCPLSVRIYKCKLRQPEQSHVTSVAVKSSVFVQLLKYIPEVVPTLNSYANM